MIYNQIYPFCKVKNAGGAKLNGHVPPPRVEFLLKLLAKEHINFILDEFMMERYPDTNFYNIVLPGSSSKMVIAHHDIINPDSDNANDNSSSVINAIALKKHCPDIHVVLLDAEEPPIMGGGSEHLAKQINDGVFGKIDWVLNLELTGRGGRNFYLGTYPGKLTDHIVKLFHCPISITPFNDSSILQRHGIDSVVINPLPLKYKKKKEKYYFGGIRVSAIAVLDTSLLNNCHHKADSLDTISTVDMKEFVEEVLVKICAKWRNHD